MTNQTTKPEMMNSPEGLESEFISRISKLITAESIEEILTLCSELHIADLADLIKQLSKEQRNTLITILSPREKIDLIAYVEHEIRSSILKHLTTKDITKAIIYLQSDDALELIEELEEDQQNAVLQKLPRQTRLHVQEALTFPEDSAGRLMQRELVAAPDFWTIGRTIDYIRATNDQLPEDFYNIFILNAKRQLVGVLSTSQLLRHPPATKIKDILDEDLYTIPATMDQEDVSQLFRQYDLISAPVIDEKSRLIGVITIDDVIAVIDEEAEEDILNLAGAGGADFHAPIIKTALLRLKWLIVALINTMIAMFVIAHFKETIENYVALAVLMPLAAAMGGNAGLQVVTVTVRSIAMREITPYNKFRVIAKESAIAGLYAIFFAFVTALVAYFWFENLKIAIALAAAMLFNLLWAGVAGSTIPILLERFDIDPAVTAGPFLSATTDVLGFLLFLGFASFLLS